jgi:Sulfatase
MIKFSCRIRLAFLAMFVAGTLTFAEAPSEVPQNGEKKPSTRRPNVLFIAVDDMRCDLGCYGVKHVLSPNLDRLAASGVLLNRAYCQQAVCNPSRASVMTGLRLDTTQVWDLVTDFRRNLPNAVPSLNTFGVTVIEPSPSAKSSTTLFRMMFLGTNRRIMQKKLSPIRQRIRIGSKSTNHR